MYVHRKGNRLNDVRTPGTLERMPNVPGNKHRSVRVSDEDWTDLEAAAKARDSDRGTVIKEFIWWYLRRPGAKMPQRPAAEPPDGSGS